MKVVVTGASGLLGWHCSARLHAKNCMASFRNIARPYSVVRLDKADFNNDATLVAAITGADAILHFAGVNKGSDDHIAMANPAIAARLKEFCKNLNVQPHIVYANSVHMKSNSAYGRSKREASEILSEIGDKYTNLVLPHIFGEGARPNYNNVTATFIQSVVNDDRPEINPDGRVSLIHAGTASEIAIDAINNNRVGIISPVGTDLSVVELFRILKSFHEVYMANIFPDLRDSFALELFNAYRSALYPQKFPIKLTENSDARGTLVEVAKGGGGGQTFFSTTKVKVERGNHFHLRKVERFLVVKGEAIIRMRRVLSDKIYEYKVSGEEPTIVDIPTLYTHSIENIGEVDLLTLFWAHELFDPENPDTFSDEVL